MKISYLFFLLGLCLLVHSVNPNDVVVKDLKLFVNGYEFIVKGMAYSPTPIGLKDMDANKEGGTGLCSPRLTPYGEWKSACFDSDYFDGSVDGTREPPSPANGWFYDVWMRDFPIMKEAGVNTIRLYNSNPVTADASKTWAASGEFGVTSPTGKSHKKFMDTAQSFGFKVIFPLVGDEALLTNRDATEIHAYIKAQIDEIGGHPALLMYTLGNELDLAGNPALLNAVSTNIKFARDYQLQKHGRSIPITSAVVDLPDSYNMLVETLPVDVFTANSGYRGLDFQDFWTGVDTPGFDGFFNLSCKHEVPVLIGEIGWHQIGDEQDRAQPDWFNHKWRSMIQNIDMGCIGGVFFEYNDEPSKVATDQQTMGIVRFEVSTTPDGLTSDQVDVWQPDTAVKKDILWNAICCGELEGQDWNFNTDIFAKLDRPPAQLDYSSSPCNGQKVITGATINSITMGGLTTGGVDTTDSGNTDSSSASTLCITLTTLLSFVVFLLL